MKNAAFIFSPGLTFELAKGALGPFSRLPYLEAMKYKAQPGFGHGTGGKDAMREKLRPKNCRQAGWSNA